MAPPALRRAGRRGAHYLGMGIPELQSIYEEARVQAGYDLSNSQTQQMQWIHIANTEDEAWSEASPHFHHLLCDYKEIAAPGTPLYEVEIPAVEDLQNRSHEIPLPMLSALQLRF